MAAPAYPLNAWYAAAYDVEVKRQLLPRTICSKPLVLYRKANGAVAALADACWHRLLPLSRGELHGDNVICGYHGLEFDDTGRCVYMPSQEGINPSAAVKSYPVVEKHRFIWVWMGEPERADPALVPDLHWNDDPAWVGDGKVIHAKCDYRLVVDNLMDLTHETYVHGSSIGNRAVAEAPFEVTHSDNTAVVTRWMKNIDAPPFWAAQLGRPGKVDRWQIIHFEAPSTICHRRRRRARRDRRAGGRPQPGRQRVRAQHDDPGDRQDLPLLLGVRAQLGSGQPDLDARACARRFPASSARTRSSLRRSSRRSTRIRITNSTT